MAALDLDRSGEELWLHTCDWAGGHASDAEPTIETISLGDDAVLTLSPTHQPLIRRATSTLCLISLDSAPERAEKAVGDGIKAVCAICGGRPIKERTFQIESHLSKSSPIMLWVVGPRTAAVL